MFFSCHTIRHPPSLLYTFDTVRLNFTSCHSARMASPPSHPLTLTCANTLTLTHTHTHTHTHRAWCEVMAEQWASHDKAFMLAPGCLCVCVSVCVLCVRHLMPTPRRHTHAVRNTDAFMDSFAHTHTHFFFPWYKRE